MTAAGSEPASWAVTSNRDAPEWLGAARRLPAGPGAGGANPRRAGLGRSAAADVLSWSLPRGRSEGVGSLTRPTIRHRPDGKVDLEDSYTLGDGSVRRQAVTLDSDNLRWFSDRLEAYLNRTVSEDEVHTRGDDAIKFRFGGTDHAPSLIIINHGLNRGTLWIAFDLGVAWVASIRHTIDANGSPK